VNNIPSQEDIKSGQAFYTKSSLSVYDLFVTKFSNRFIWQCPRKVLIQFFKEHTSTNHLDIGVGTGYFLKQLHLIPGKQRIGLLDLNQDCLDHAKDELKEFTPEIYHYDIFTPFTSITKKFDSVSLNYVLHCLPGTLPQKALAFDHIKAVLNPHGKLFGTTILGKNVKHNWLAKKMLGIYNDKKIMHNLNDDYDTLNTELHKRFANVQVTIHGSVALFVANI
jgi:ubiquinone/menaquinone biosynthesis C-methylase UbiE